MRFLSKEQEALVCLLLVALLACGSQRTSEPAERSKTLSPSSSPREPSYERDTFYLVAIVDASASASASGRAGSRTCAGSLVNKTTVC